MQDYQITDILNQISLPCQCKEPSLIETHISWVILCDEYVFKIKKPIKYSFLDFSTIQKRKYFLERELQLNKRLSSNVYLEILPIHILNNHYIIGGKDGILIDYTLKMRKMDADRRMDRMVKSHKVNFEQIQKLAKTVANFHQHAHIASNVEAHLIKDHFNELANEIPYINKEMGSFTAKITQDALLMNQDVHIYFDWLFQQRYEEGWIKDLHGDLHCRNIFLEEEPIIFDCIEFNDAYRKIDVLNEIAFICMDLEAFGASELSEYFLQAYLANTGYSFGENEHFLFTYFKAYRANVRAKVNVLRAKSINDPKERKPLLEEVEKYIFQMNDYLTYLHKFDENQ